jgi:uncharacterized repeat protein (TIGR02543 family)
MKTLKSIFKGLNIFAVLFACVLISACSNGISGEGGKKEGASNGKAYISAVSLGNGERAIVPTGSFDLKGEEIYKYVLSARPAGGTKDLELGHWVRTEDEDGDPVSAYYAMEKDLREGAIQLGTGAYIFTIQVYVLPDGITYEGDDSGDVEDGEEAENLSIDSQAILVLEKTTDPVSIVSGSNKIRFGTLNEASGNGTLSLTVKFPDEGVQSVTVDLTPQDEGNTHSVSNKSLAISEASGGYRSVIFDDNPSNGWYIVKFNFTINNGVRDTNQVWSELVQIATGRQTKKDDIVIENLNTLYPITYNCKGGRLKGDSISLSYTPYQGAIPMPEVADRNVATFAGWYSDPDFQNKVTQIPAGSKGAKTFYAKWKYNIEEGKLYASGEKLIVKKDSDSDTIVRAYFDEVNPDNAVLNDDGRLLNIYSWKVYGSKKDGTYPEGTTDDITVESGSLLGVYANGNEGHVTVNGGKVLLVRSDGQGGTINVTGGTISGDDNDDNIAIYIAGGDTTIDISGGIIDGYVRGANGVTDTTIRVSGNPVIGDGKNVGIDLSIAKDAKLRAGNLDAASEKAITVLAPDPKDGTVVVTFDDASKAYAKFFVIENSNRTREAKVDGANIKIKGGLSLPATLKPVEGKENAFNLASGNVTVDGTIFSVFAEDGYFTLSKTTLKNATCDMGIPVDATGKPQQFVYKDGVTTDKMYRYIQFTSESGQISTDDADGFLTSIEFHRIDNKPIFIRINLEQLSLQANDPDAGYYKLNDTVFYLDGSFYMKSEPFATGTKSWPEAYNEAKQKKFNNMQGYLMTITSDAENKFVYDQLFKGKKPDEVGSWIGGTRTIPKNGYDAATWEKKGYNDYWTWACGPEAIEKDKDTGEYCKRIFYTTARYPKDGKSYRAPGMYSSWSNPVDCELNGIEWFYNGINADDTGKKQADYEPNNKDKDFSVKQDDEYYTQYTGRYVWNDANEKKPYADSNPGRWKIHYYIVEFTPYENPETGERHVPRAERMHAEATY